MNWNFMGGWVVGLEYLFNFIFNLVDSGFFFNENVKEKIEDPVRKKIKLK